MKLEVGKKYTDGRDVVEVKFFDYEGTAWCLSNRNYCKYIHKNESNWREVVDKPDPGEGWRLLEVGEDLQTGDECYLKFDDPYDDWAKVNCSNNKQTPGMYYRRRIAPQYVPYTWDDRDELRGRWFRRKTKESWQTNYERLACFFYLIDGHFYVNSIRNDELLNECEWLDGTPCGKKVV